MATETERLFGQHFASELTIGFDSLKIEFFGLELNFHYFIPNLFGFDPSKVFFIFTMNKFICSEPNKDHDEWIIDPEG